MGEYLRGTELDDVKIRLRILDTTVQEYLFHSNDKLPANLKALVVAKVLSSNLLVDPWGKEFLYEISGKRNQGEKPDIWTETPDKKVIGNWMREGKQGRRHAAYTLDRKRAGSRQGLLPGAPQCLVVLRERMVTVEQRDRSTRRKTRFRLPAKLYLPKLACARTSVFTNEFVPSENGLAIPQRSALSGTSQHGQPTIFSCSPGKKALVPA